MLSFVTTPQLQRLDFDYGIVAVVTKRGGYLVHPTGDDAIWDVWADVVGQLFGGGWVVDDPYPHPTLAAWLVTLAHRL